MSSVFWVFRKVSNNETAFVGMLFALGICGKARSNPKLFSLPLLRPKERLRRNEKSLNLRKKKFCHARKIPETERKVIVAMGGILFPLSYFPGKSQ